MAILKNIASKSSNYGAALEYLIFKYDELRKTPILDQNGNRIMRDEFYLDGLNCEPYSFDAACQQLNREYQKNKNKNEIKSHHYIISFDPRDSTENCLTGKRAQELGLEYAKANFPGHQAFTAELGLFCDGLASSQRGATVGLTAAPSIFSFSIGIMPTIEAVLNVMLFFSLHNVKKSFDCRVQVCLRTCELSQPSLVNCIWMLY